jgi:hypothetical protein
VLRHNIWSGGLLTVVVTIVGWLILLRGVLLLLSPAQAVGLFTGLHFEHLFYLYLTISLLFDAGLTCGRFSARSR